MDQPGYVVLSRLSAQLRATQVLANNLANADTPGFRAERPVFASYISRARGPGRWAATSPIASTGRIGGIPSRGRSPPRATRSTWRCAAMGSSCWRRRTASATPGRGTSPSTPPAASPIRMAMRCSIRAASRSPWRRGTAGSRSSATARCAARTASSAKSGWCASPIRRGCGRRARGCSRPRTRRRRCREPQLVQGAVEGSNVSAIGEMTRLTEQVRQFQFATQLAEREGDRLSTAVDRILRRRS